MSLLLGFVARTVQDPVLGAIYSFSACMASANAPFWIVDVLTLALFCVVYPFFVCSCRLTQGDRERVID